MRIVTGKGKTTAIIRECARLNKLEGRLVYIVCASNKDCYRVEREAFQAGTPVPFPLTFLELVTRKHGMRITDVLIDDVERCVEAVTSRNVVMMSVTVPEDIHDPVWVKKHKREAD